MPSNRSLVKSYLSISNILFWDDPAKLICDFILHPGMQLSETWAIGLRRALSLCLKKIDNYHRDTVIFNYALRWCLIMLNVFVHSYNELSTLGTKRARLDNLKIFSPFQRQRNVASSDKQKLVKFMQVSRSGSPPRLRGELR